MDSFISWTGGKKLLRKKVLEAFPEQGAFQRYIEVFGGAGWILFSSVKHAKMEVYNDRDGNLVNLFRCVKYHPQELRRELEFILVSREQFFDAKEQMEARGLTDIQRAARFYILIKESFGSDIQTFGVRPKDMANAIEYISEVSKRLRMVVIENQDFGRILETYDKQESFFYLDPPYYQTEKYYKERFLPEDHIRLKKKLKGLKGKFLLSYNDCPYIRELYKEYEILEVDRAHNLLQGKEKPRYKELIIKNY